MLEIGGMRLYDVRDLAAQLQLNEKTVRSMLRSGKLRGRKLAKKWYVPEDTLKAYFQDNDENSA